MRVNFNKKASLIDYREKFWTFGKISSHHIIDNPLIITNLIGAE